MGKLTETDDLEKCLGFLRRFMDNMPPEICESRRFYVALTAMKRMLELNAPVPERLQFVADEGAGLLYAQEWTEMTSSPGVKT